MKYIITESQYEKLYEEFISRIKRRISSLSDYVNLAVQNQLDICTDFPDEYDYADAIIEEVVDRLLEDINDNVYDEDFYPDVRDNLVTFCRDTFGADLLEDYKFTCEQ